MHKLDFARNKLDRLIGQYSGSFMSNVKWVKLLDVLSSIEGLNCKASVKLVWDDKPRDFRLDDEIEFKFDYYESAMEAMITGYPNGWYDYKEIEWLKITAKEELLRKITLAMCDVGKFETRLKPNEIILFAYK